MGFRWSEVQILSPRPINQVVMRCFSDHLPGPVTNLCQSHRKGWYQCSWHPLPDVRIEVPCRGFPILPFPAILKETYRTGYANWPRYDADHASGNSECRRASRRSTMLSRKPIDAYGTSGFGLIGVNPRNTATKINLSPFQQLDIGLP